MNASLLVCTGTSGAAVSRMADRFPRATDTSGLLGELEPGARIGEYRIESARPSRGAGRSYEATHLVLPRRVTLKVIPAADALPRAVAIDLLREACLIDALDHPGIPRVYECGLLPDRRPWVASELIDGPSLARRVPMSVREAAGVLRDVADILEHAHARNIAHHNVVPEAVIFPHAIRRFPLCLVDWSEAREKSRSSDDIYSLGVIARELLATSPRENRPPIFTALINRMLDVDPRMRPTAKTVREHTAWLATQIAGDSVPTPIEDEHTEQILYAITSEQSAEVTGEID